MTLFNSADILGPKQVSESHQRHLETYKHFFAHSKAKCDVFLKASFDAKNAILKENNSQHEKLLPMDVCAHQNLSRCRRITPNTLLNSLWRRQCFTSQSFARKTPSLEKTPPSKLGYQNLIFVWVHVSRMTCPINFFVWFILLFRNMISLSRLTYLLIHLANGVGLTLRSMLQTSLTIYS